MSLESCENSVAQAKRGDRTASAAKAEMDTNGTKAKTGILNFKNTLRNSWQSEECGSDNCGNSEAEAKLGWSDSVSGGAEMATKAKYKDF